MIHEKLRTEDHDLVRSRKIETCAARQRRNEENKDFRLILKSIDQGHA